MLEYVVLGDYQTAVGFLLASTPDRSARYYRDALCTIALAVRIRSLAFKKLLHTALGPRTDRSVPLQAASPEMGQTGGAAANEPASRSLHVQVAKVITANAAAAGDTLLGVPLLCSAGAIPTLRRLLLALHLRNSLQSASHDSGVSGCCSA